MDKKKGLYAGTTSNMSWWKRFFSKECWEHYKGLFMRGNGEYWYDNEGFYFLRYLTKYPIFIPFEKMMEIELVKRHAGKWLWGYPILKIVWKKERNENLILSSGFFVSKDIRDATKLIGILQGKIKT